jgi:hypothetical protein
MTKNVTVITMSGRHLPIELEDAESLEDLEKQVNTLTGIQFAHNALENVYDDEERNKIIEQYKENGPGFLTSTGKFITSGQELNNNETYRVVLSKYK